ncbi:hypothetical protein [Pricia sp.]
MTLIATTRNPKKESLLLKNGASQGVIDDGFITSKVRKLFPKRR